MKIFLMFEAMYQPNYLIASRQALPYTNIITGLYAITEFTSIICYSLWNHKCHNPSYFLTFHVLFYEIRIISFLLEFIIIIIIIIIIKIFTYLSHFYSTIWNFYSVLQLPYSLKIPMFNYAVFYFASILYDILFFCRNPLLTYVSMLICIWPNFY